MEQGTSRAPRDGIWGSAAAHALPAELHDAHLDGVDDLLDDEDRADDDDGVAFVEAALLDQTFQRGFDGVLRVNHVEGHDEGRDAPAEREAAGDVVERGHGVDGRVARAEPTSVAGHVAVPGEDKDGGSPQFVGHDDGALDEFLARGSHDGAFEKIRAAAAFDAGGNAVKDFDAAQGMFADGGFAAEHDGIGLFVN